MGKISVDAFLREYGVAAKQKGSTMETFIKKHITTHYVPILVKDVHCTKIIEASCHAPDSNIIKFNSLLKYIATPMRLIDLYTDIIVIFEEGAFIDQYDKLNEVGAVDELIKLIPEKEIVEFYDVLNMKLSDFRDNEYSLEALSYNIKESFSISEDVINSAIEELKKQIESTE